MGSDQVTVIVMINDDDGVHVGNLRGIEFLAQAEQALKLEPTVTDGWVTCYVPKDGIRPSERVIKLAARSFAIVGHQEHYGSRQHDAVWMHPHAAADLLNYLRRLGTFRVVAGWSVLVARWKAHQDTLAGDFLADDGAPAPEISDINGRRIGLGDRIEFSRVRERKRERMTVCRLQPLVTADVLVEGTYRGKPLAFHLSETAKEGYQGYAITRLGKR